MKKDMKSFIALLVFFSVCCYQQTKAQPYRTYTNIASSLNPSTVGTSVTFTATVKDFDFRNPQIVNEGTVTFSEGATVLAANVAVATGLASFSTTALAAGTHVIKAVYNGTATFATSNGSIAQTVDGTEPCQTYAGNIAYVNASATPGTNDGTTWARAFLTLQAALDAARTCGVTQIWVARGTYVPTTYPIGAATSFGGDLTSGNFSFHLVNGVSIYGGFSGSGTETQLDQRNWVQNPTILSGSNARHHVVTSANDGLATGLDGFTITGGYANGTTQLNVEGTFFTGSLGGGAYLNSSSLTLTNLLISGNSTPSTDFSGGSGGGMEMRGGGGSVLTNVAFVGNSAYSGAGLNTVLSPFTMTNCVFSGNRSNSGGGGIFITASANTLTNVVFANNAATRTTSFGADGGALVNNGSTTITTLINCTFFGNSSTGTGGTMYNVNGATVNDKNGIYYNNSNNGNTPYNGVFNYSSSGIFTDRFNPTTTLSGTDPKFVNAAVPDGPDNRWMTADDGLAIQSTSPAINAGTLAGAPATDIRGFARTGNPDQGAYEYVLPGPTASVLSVNGTSTICRGTSANLIVTITGGTSPYTVVYSDGTNSFTIAGYTSGTAIPVSPTVNTTYSLVSVTDAGSIAGTGNSGTPTITVTDPPTWYLDADGDTYYVSSVSSCTSPGAGYNTTGGTLGDCNDANKDVWQSASLYIDVDGDGYDAGSETVCYGAAIPPGYKATTLGSDCKDDDASVHALQTYYRDVDGDTYGSSVTTQICSSTSPAGFVTRSGDCNDSDPAISPAAVEVCGNKIDDNCNGRIDEQPCSPCLNATNFTTTNITATSAKLNWTAVANPVQWQVQYKTTKPGSKWIDVLLTGNARSVIISPLLSSQNYMWHIRAKCGKAWTEYSGSIQFTTLAAATKVHAVNTESSKPVPGEEQEGAFRVQNYPNPFSSVTTIRYTLPVEAQVNLIVHNQLGQKVAVLVSAKQGAGTHQVNFNAAKAGAGVYQYRLQAVDANGKIHTLSGKMVMKK